MLEEIPLDDVDFKPLVFPIRSERLSDPIININGNEDEQQTIVTNILKKGKKVFLQQPSYSKLAEDESEAGDPIEERVSFLTFSQKYDSKLDSFIQISSNLNVQPCKKKHCRCLCYVLFTILSIVVIFVFGFGLGQTYHRQSSEYLMIV